MHRLRIFLNISEKNGARNAERRRLRFSAGVRTGRALREQAQDVLRRLLRLEGDRVQTEGEAGADEVGVIRRQAVQELLHIAAADAEDFGGADAIAVDVVVQQAGERELIVAAAGLCEFIEGVEDDAGRVGAGMCGA